MFTVRRIFRSKKPLTNYIYTSNVIRRDESEKTNESNERQEKRKEDLNTKKKERPEMKNLFSLDPAREIKKISEAPKKTKKKLEAPEPVKVEPKADFFQKIFASSLNEVAKEVGGDQKQTKKELLGYIKTFDVSKEKPEETPKPDIRRMSISLNSEFSNWNPLNIFDGQKMKNAEEQLELNIWESLEAEELEYMCLKSPTNHFEELIAWTNEGRLWHFPIDNDQGREEEGKVSFTDHVFLERHLEPWCPKRGPIRRFMELVLTGLSKNYHLTLEEKKEHLAWFEKYFEDKKKLLQELGAVGAVKKIETTAAEENPSGAS